MDKELLEDYQNACNAYLQAFCDKHGFDISDTYWVGDNVGTIAQIADYSVSMDTIITDMNKEVPENVFPIYYQFTLIDKYNIPYSAWLKKSLKEHLIDLFNDIKSNDEQIIHQYNELTRSLIGFFGTCSKETIHEEFRNNCLN